MTITPSQNSHAKHTEWPFLLCLSIIDSSHYQFVPGKYVAIPLHH